MTEAVKEATIYLLGEMQHSLKGDLFAGTVVTHVSLMVTLDAPEGGPGTFEMKLSI